MAEVKNKKVEMLNHDEPEQAPAAEVEETKAAEETVAPAVDSKKGEMVTIIIDVENPITVNGRQYRGKITVSKEKADDLLRIQEEHQEVIRGMVSDNPRITVKSRLQIETAFVDVDNKGDAELGLLPRWMWNKLSPSFREELKELRSQVKGV